MHVSPLAASFSLLHSGEVGAVPVTRFFSHLHACVDAGAGRREQVMATLIRSDLEFILEQILIAEQHAAGADLTTLVPNSFVAFGLRTVDGSFNHLFPGQQFFGAADQLFPRLLDPSFRTGDTFGTYASDGTVVDSQPRTISNLIVDQTITNPAAVDAFVSAGFGILADGTQINPDTLLPYPVGTLLDLNNLAIPAGVTLTIPNVAPDEGLSAGFNSWFTFFGQFFDHGLDLVTKGGNGVVIVPLQPDDPLFVEGGSTNFMLLTRATQFDGPGADGVLGDDLTTVGVDESLDDTTQETQNTTTPFVDQNQTYTSHPSHQVFLREYVLGTDGKPVATGRLLDNADNGGIPTWAQVKAQALAMLGIELSDIDVHDVPLLRTDLYGNFIPDLATGFAQVITGAGPDGILNTDDDLVVVGSPGTPVSPTAVGAQRTHHAFLNDIAHNAAPAVGLDADADSDISTTADVQPAGTYDDELLDRHFVTGDGRGNENIALTAVHHIFHSEHNRQVEEIKATILASGDAAFIESWQLSPGVWDGERLFQAAKFATEMQYQHLVFEEFARKVQPMIDAFLAPEGFDTAINPAIVAEFAHTVYRFGHSMLTETVDRLDPNFLSSDIGLVEAFLNPLAFDNDGALSAEQAAGAIVRGMTRQTGNEIDEFVTEALRNNLLGLPLDLPTINLTRGRDTGVPSLNAARREFYDMTSDSQLKPYTSWLDLTQHLKHEASVINFIAAYGTHDTITTIEDSVTGLDRETTLAEKRAAATAIVFGIAQTIPDKNSTEANPLPDIVFTPPADSLDFLNSTGTYANLANGVTTTGVDDIDLWVGGLAEKQMPFGGLLGSTFNFVFETQMEALQNHDRFYYLARLAGLNFLTEMENNSFAKLVMLNTDTTHLPADIFSTPTWILEVDQSKQFNDTDGDGVLDSLDPVGGTELLPLVIRDNPATPGEDTNYLRYTGPDHVVLGGTNPGNASNPSGNDILIGSEGDDTFWGDGGNDTIEGGAGNDQVEAGDGDDIITDLGGDDNLKGNGGNDVIQGGQGFNLILGGTGSDFIITGEDVSETFAGAGNDFILGAQMNLPTFGNEGDDWIEIGTSDGAGGDNFDPQEDSTVIGHDVFITGGGFDEADGEGGDDIMVFSDGEDHFGGGGGFDWASYANDQLGVTADLNTNDLIEPPVAPSNQGILDRFADVEGLSGSDFADVLRGDDATVADIDIAGPLNGVLTRIGLINGLQDLLGAGVTSFGTGNIILGGGGSDIIEGRGGDDLIDGDKSLNVRISVRSGFDANGPFATEIATFDSLSDPTLLQNMLDGTWNPGQLQIVREILTGDDGFDTAVFSAPFNDPITGANNYNIFVNDNGTAADFSDDIVTVIDNVAGRDGTDTLKGIERLQFNDLSITLVPGLNEDPQGLLIVNDDSPSVGQLLTVSATDNPLTPLVNEAVTDADNITPANPLGLITNGPISYTWQVERDPVNTPNVFEDIVALGGGNPATAAGNAFRVTPDLLGLSLRVKAIYQDANGVLETVFSAPTAAVGAGVFPTPAAPPAETPVASLGGGLHLIRADLQFILDQIKIAELRPDGNVLDVIANSRLPFGLRTVDGTFNNLVQGQTNFGASDQDFVLQLDQIFRDDHDGDSFDTNGPAPNGVVNNTNYANTGNVADADPRIISNLISDQTATNLSAAIANGDAEAVLSPGLDGIFGTEDDREVFFIPNATPDAALSAGFNVWFVFFGQFFDHGLDLVDKGPGTVYIPLQDDDPLIAGADGLFNTDDDLPVQQRFMAVTRATNSSVDPGPDDILGTADDIHLHNNETTPFVDQNQTYTSHASHQVFLREYELNGLGRPVATGRLIDGDTGGIGNWAEVKAQAASMLGIQLVDADIDNVPLLRTDAYGRFIPGANGFAQFIIGLGADGLANTDDDVLTPANPADNGNLGTLVPANALRTGHAFLNDIAHNAVPGTVFDPDDIPGGPLNVVAPDDDNVAGNTIDVDFAGRKVAYDDELLDAHFVTGDGRGNENIGLTAVHFVFHAEHNRLVEHIKAVVTASNDPDFIAEWKLPDGSWNGERLFQAARFGTEMQYQHLVFEEFARKVQPQVDVFLQEGQGYDSTINPAIVAEFAHVVYRFGHSMLTETVDRFDPSFNVIGNPNGLDPVDQQMGLIAAFLNPLAFAQTVDGVATLTATEGASAIIRGVTRAAGNEIDEFVTEALRNNLVGLPLDLPAINLARGRDTGVPTLNQARAEFYLMTGGDSQLKPYASWVDFASNLKHVESLVNFIAAYGTHGSITGATTTLAKRAAAIDLVFGGGAVSDEERLAFLNGPAATTGVDAIDLWIGGLAEKQMPFGGLLGSTFNFVFETQMEKLQNGDRFYYLERTAGLNFLTELENNSFAKLIMANTDATHLPGDVFSTPAFILEVNQALQYNPSVIPGPDGILLDDPLTPVDESADNLLPTDDPVGGTALTPLVIRNDPNTTDPNPFYLQYTGEDHVVLGGTEFNDTIISSIGDDTLYGDAGNDRLEGGNGVDIIFGGTGDDIITDQGGDDNLQGQDGNDAIHGGNGINLILGGFGHDFIVIGEDESEAFGGPGNDFIFGVKPVEMIFGNEGDDWIEHGMADGSAGENFDTRGLDAIIGNDVFMGDTVADRMLGEGGDDIMIGNGGFGDRYIGASGFDWASFQHPTLGATADLNLRAFDETPVAPSQASALARFESTEGLSGSRFSDILRGDDADAVAIAASGFTGSVLTNIGLITGLQDFLDDMIGNGSPVTSFGAGNIILGGLGSDIIEGRGGDDLIDGDARLNVQIGVYAIDDVDHNGPILSRHDSMTTLSADIFAGLINPGQLGIIRELVDTGHAVGIDFDTAVFSDPFESLFDTDGDNTTPPVPLDNYLIEPNANGTFTITHLLRDGDGTIIGTGIDGVDTLRGIERLQFADQSIVLGGLNDEPVGLLDIDAGLVDLDNDTDDPADDIAPVEDQLLTVSIADVTDGDNVSPTNPTGAITGPVSYFWQVDTRGDGVFEDIVLATGLGDVRATGTTFTPGDAEAGLRLRVRAVYQDANGVLETVFSAPTAPVANVNDAPVGIVAIDDTSPTESRTLTAQNLFTDADGLDGAVFAYQWQRLDGADWVPVGADSPQFTPTQAEVGHQLRVIVSYIDDQGTTETLTSAPTGPVGDFIDVNGAAQTLNGNGGDDLIFGGGGNDTINGGAGSDTLDGGTGADIINGNDGNDVITGGLGNDTVNGGAGSDLINYTMGDGAGAVVGGNGAGDVDTLNIIGTADPEVLDVIFNGSALTTVEGGSVAQIESVTANLLGGADGLSYGAATASAVTVNLATGTASGFTSIGGIENVTGGSNLDLLIGNGLDNVLSGNGGNDTLIGGLGADTLTGGGGTDTASYAGETADLTISLADNTGGVAGEDIFGSIENVIGGQGDDSITGFTGTNRLEGGEGDDTLRGGAGSDTVLGQDGNDIIVYNAGDGNDAVVDGGSGDDTLQITTNGGPNAVTVTYNGSPLTAIAGIAASIVSVEHVSLDLGTGTDILTYAAASVGVSVDLGAQTASGFSAVTNIENVTGGGGNDTLTGDALQNLLSGAGGNDTLKGAGGNDTLMGGAGDDTFLASEGGDGNDSYVGNGGLDTYDLHATDADAIITTTTASSADIGSDTLNGIENVIGSQGADNISLNGGANVIDGQGGNDTINAGAGNDIVTGGAGNDTMNGGAGGDTFVFTGGFGADVINGFDATGTGSLTDQDLLDVSGFVGADDINAGNFTTRVNIQVVAGNTVVTIDGNTITLNGIAAGVTVQDFIL
jgi:Ca2+-binding RTX toxin-like protein